MPEVMTFLVVLLITMVMLSMAAIVVLGDQLQEFTTLGSALTFLFKFMVTGDLGRLPVAVAGVGVERGAISELAIWLFYFLMFFLLVCILLNFILAIVTRAYLIAQTQHSESPTILQDLRDMASAGIRPNRRSERRVMSRFREAAALPWGGKHASAQVTAIVRGIDVQGRLWPEKRLENMLIRAAESSIKNGNDLPGAPFPPFSSYYYYSLPGMPAYPCLMMYGASQVVAFMRITQPYYRTSSRVLYRTRVALLLLVLYKFVRAAQPPPRKNPLNPAHAQCSSYSYEYQEKLEQGVLYELSFKN